MKILYFAWVRQKIGMGEEDFAPAKNPMNIAELVEALRARGNGYAEAFRDLSRLRCAVNQEHATLDRKVGATDEIAFFPPVTGG